MTVQNIYKRLAEIGYSKTYLQKRILPEWWDDKIAQTQSGIMEMAFILSRRLGLNPSALITGQAQLVSIEEESTIKFKTGKTNTIQNSEIQKSIQGFLNHLGYVINATFTKSYVGIDESPERIRTQILNKNPYVGLEQLLSYCIEIGIPVIHVADSPFGTVDGLVFKVENRPIIVITHKRQKFSGWLAFIIAHELGHIACGHLEHSHILLDESITTQSEGANKSDDLEENQANDFARTLLIGDPELGFSAPFRLNGHQLALSAERIAKRLQIDPSIIALNYTWNEGMWGAGINALKELEPNANAPKQVNRLLAHFLSSEGVHDSEWSYLEQIMDIEMEDLVLV